MADQPINRPQLEYYLELINKFYKQMEEIPKWDSEKVDKRMQMIEFASQILIHHYHKFDLNLDEYIAFQDGVAEILTAGKKRQKELAEQKSKVANRPSEGTPVSTLPNSSKRSSSGFPDEHYRKLLDNDEGRAPVPQNKNTFDKNRSNVGHNNFQAQPREQAQHSNRPNSQVNNNKFQLNPKAPAFVGKSSKKPQNNVEPIYPPPNVSHRQSNAGGANGSNFNRGGGGGLAKFKGQHYG